MLIDQRKGMFTSFTVCRSLRKNTETRIDNQKKKSQSWPGVRFKFLNKVLVLVHGKNILMGK